MKIDFTHVLKIIKGEPLKEQEFFDNPVYLWYLISIPILIISHFTFIKNANYKALRFANFDTIKRITGKGSDKVITKNWLILLIRLIILLSVIIAISGPIFWYEGLSHEQDFVIAIDTSASMLAKDFPPNRLGFAKEQVKEFVNKLKPNTKIALIDFAGSAFIDQTMTQDRKQIIEAIDKLEIVPIGGTDLAGAIISASNLLINSDKGRLMVLVSDGSNSVDVYNNRALNIALDYAKNNQIIIHTLGIGSNTSSVGYLPEYYNVTAVYDVEQLKYISNITRGISYTGSDEASFSVALDNIVSNSEKAYIQKDLRPLFLLIALLCLFLEWGLTNTRFKRLP